MPTSSRDRWIADQAERLAPVLEQVGYSADDCQRLATLMHDMDVDAGTRDLSPEQLILQELLLMQDVDPVTAGVLARTMTRVDWGKIEIASRLAAELLGVSRNTLLENMLADRVPAWNVIMSGDRQDYITYGLARILYTHAWRRKHPSTGGPVSSFPPAEYNAARYVIERRRRERDAARGS